MADAQSEDENQPWISNGHPHFNMGQHHVRNIAWDILFLYLDGFTMDNSQSQALDII